MAEGAFVYRLRRSHTSQRYGPCEVCHQYCSDVFIQVEMREYRTERGEISQTSQGCRAHTFGHEACLRGIQKGHDAAPAR